MKLNNRGQATAELALMGTVILMLLGYLMQQGTLYNARQGLEMYAYREALRQSKASERGATLTVVRDVVTPSFFSGLSRQRIMATASVDTNYNKLYEPDEPEDVGSKQYLQIGDAMILNQRLIEIPRIKVNVNYDGDDEDAKDQWVTASIKEIDAQRLSSRSSAYHYNSRNQYPNRTGNTLPRQNRIITKELKNEEAADLGLTFEDANTVTQNYYDNDWTANGEDGHVDSASTYANTIPQTAVIRLSETITRDKRTVTPPHYRRLQGR